MTAFHRESLKDFRFSSALPYARIGKELKAIEFY
jgi:hypothetical protein